MCNMHLCMRMHTAMYWSWSVGPQGRARVTACARARAGSGVVRYCYLTPHTKVWVQVRAIRVRVATKASTTNITGVISDAVRRGRC